MFFHKLDIVYLIISRFLGIETTSKLFQFFFCCWTNEQETDTLLDIFFSIRYIFQLTYALMKMKYEREKIAKFLENSFQYQPKTRRSNQILHNRTRFSFQFLRYCVKMTVDFKENFYIIPLRALVSSRIKIILLDIVCQL